MTTIKMPVWQRAAVRAAEMAAAGKTWTLGKSKDAQAVWAAGPGTKSYEMYAEPGAVAVVVVEYRRPEGYGSDDASRGGFFLDPRSGSVRVALHASVARGEDGSLSLGEWRDEDGKVSSRKPHSLVTEVYEW